MGQALDRPNLQMRNQSPEGETESILQVTQSVSSERGLKSGLNPHPPAWPPHCSSTAIPGPTFYRYYERKSGFGKSVRRLTWWSDTSLALKMGLLLVKDPELPNIPELAKAHTSGLREVQLLCFQLKTRIFFPSLYKQQVVFLVLSWMPGLNKK